MIAEESAKWSSEFSHCRNKRELDSVLRKLAGIEKIPIQPGKEPYERIADRLGLAEGSKIREAFDCALARVHRVYG